MGVFGSWYTEPQDTSAPAPAPALLCPDPARQDQAPYPTGTFLLAGKRGPHPAPMLGSAPWGAHGGCLLLPTPATPLLHCPALGGDTVVSLPGARPPLPPATSQPHSPSPNSHPPGRWSLPQKSPLASACMVTPRQPRHRPRCPALAWAHRLPGGERGCHQGSLPAHRSADSRQSAEPGSSWLQPPHRC